MCSINSDSKPNEVIRNNGDVNQGEPLTVIVNYTIPVMNHQEYKY